MLRIVLEDNSSVLAKKCYGRNSNTETKETFSKAASQDTIQKAAVGKGMAKEAGRASARLSLCPVLRLRLDSMKAGPEQPYTDENSKTRGASVVETPFPAGPVSGNNCTLSK